MNARRISGKMLAMSKIVVNRTVNTFRYESWGSCYKNRSKTTRNRGRVAILVQIHGQFPPQPTSILALTPVRVPLEVVNGRLSWLVCVNLR